MAHGAPQSFSTLLSADSGQAAPSIAAVLDEQSPAERLLLLRRAEPKDLAKLFELCREQPLDLDHLVPAGVPHPAETLHDGVNSLLLFRNFQKRFFRAQDGRIAGYNPGPFNWAITPGYFCVRREQEHLVFDYTALPSQVPEGWPRPIPNDQKLGRFVYHGLRDEMRHVSRHVCVGAVFRHGNPIGTWFALCRREE